MKKRPDKRPDSAGKALFGFDESMFQLPKEDDGGAAVAAHALDVRTLLAGLDDAEQVGANDDDVDENDPTLLAALAEVQRGERRGSNNAEENLATLRQELESEREAMALFEREGEDTSDMRATVQALLERIVQLEAQSSGSGAEVEVRFAELKAAASAWNAAGDKERARLYLQQAKDVRAGAIHGLPPKPVMPPTAAAAVAQLMPQQVQIQPQRQQPEPVSKVQRTVPEPAVARQVSETSAPPPESKEAQEAKSALARLRSSRALRRATDAQKWDALLGGLRDEARRANTLALELKETDKKLAVDCFRRQKECMAMLERSLELKASGSAAPAWEANVPFSIKRVVTNDAVPDDGMLVHVVRGGDVATDKGAPTSSFVKILYSYHPNAETAADAVFSSSVLTPGTRSPEWNWSQVLPIQRKKTFQKWLERKDLRVELWESKGWLRGGDVLVGRVDIPVEPLLRKCTVRGVFPVMSNRKRVGPQLEICVMLRTPLLGPEQDVREERWIAVSAWPEMGPSAQELSDAAEEEKLEAALEARRKIANPFAAPFNLRDAITMINAPERMKSVAVLQYMASELRRIGTDRVEESGDTMRLLARVEKRLVLIKASVGSATEYGECMAQAVQDETTLAQHFKAAGDKDAAIGCLKRIKLMRGEVEQQRAASPSPPPVSQPLVSAVAAAAATSSPAVVAAPQAPVVQVADDGSDAVDSLVSVAVIDFELSQLGSDDDAQIRKSDLEIRRQMIVLSIEMGTLTAETYAANLQRRIALDRQLAKSANDRGDKAKAMRHLKRAKLMENELAS